MNTKLWPSLCAAVAATTLWLSGCANPGTPPSHGPAATAGAAYAANDVNACKDADTRLTPSRREHDRRLVSALLAGDAGTAGIRIGQSMQLDGWILVRAATPFWNPGWFVFEKAGATTEFRNVWNGMGPRRDREDLVAWATALGAPAGFVQCFANTVMG